MKKLIEQIDTLLPQTQCGQCSYSGCLPYAEAIAEKDEAINRCPPGGVKTLKALAKLLEKDVQPFLEEMKKQERPPMAAYIREAECIACTKCIQACPVDAILGAAKQCHTVLIQECTGCGLCVSPCPVDCIDMIALEVPVYQPQKARQRFYAREKRLDKVKYQIKERKKNEELSDQCAYIEAAVARAKTKKEIISKKIYS
ncbi:MAG: RnfABCDGE type electron transport complex subunit B [Pseudomonadota bacterium]